jgi:hypothetical protein
LADHLAVLKTDIDWLTALVAEAGDGIKEVRRLLPGKTSNVK